MCSQPLPPTGGPRRSAAGHLLGVVLLLASVLCAPAAADGQRVLHLTLEGDLDSTHLARELAAAIGAAHDEHDLVLLELGANAWRRDVLWRLGLAIEDARAPVHALLRDDRDGRVGLGALVVALLCEQASIAPGTRVLAEAGDDLEELTPEGVDERRVRRELGGLLWVAVARRGMPGEISEALLEGRTGLWLDTEEGLPVLRVEPPAPGAPRLLSVTPEGTVVGEIEPGDLLALGLVDTEARAARGHLREVGLERARLSSRRVRSRLEGARERVEALLARADAHIENVRARFDALRYPPDDRVVPAHAWREGGRLALEELGEAERALRRAERLFDDHAELLRTQAPEGTPVGRSDRQNARDWRRAFLDRRRDIEYLEDRARTYARR